MNRAPLRHPNRIPYYDCMKINGKVSICVLWCGGALLLAQTPPRAIPVEEPGAPPRAIPVEPAPPKAEPVGTEPAKKKGPDEDLYEYGALCYSQKDYQIAIKPFGDYVRLYPKGSHAPEALFRLGECYLKTGQQEEAKLSYRSLLSQYPNSESAASGAYRLGTLAYGERDYAAAASHFEVSEKKTTSSEVRLASTYNKALCQKYAGQTIKALISFKAVAAVRENNSYRESALLEVANNALEAGKKADALAAFSEIVNVTKDSKVLGDALLRSGLLLNEFGKTEEATANFTRALNSKDLPNEQRGIASFGLVQGYYVKGDYDAVIKAYSTNATALPPADVQPKYLLIVGNAYKQRQMYRQAVDVFLNIEKNYAEAPESIDAGYQKLLCFFQLSDKDIPQFAENFEQRYVKQFPDHEYIFMARLIRADWWFGKGDYKQSAEVFAGVDLKRVPEKVRASVIYKKGFAESEAGKAADAINSLTIFLTDYPKDPNVPVALAQRGISNRAMRAFDRAIADFGAIIKNHSGHSALEMAYYQSGLVKSETRDLPGMVADFEALVNKFPNSPAAAEACYRIGRGYFEMKQAAMYEKALAPLRKSIALDSKTWLDKSSQLLISCQYLREDVDGLAKEIDAYFEARKEASVSPNVLTFLGVKLYERRDFRQSAKFLGRATTPAEPNLTQSLVWNYLGKAELENGKFEEAVKALEFYLQQTPTGVGRAQALLTKGHAHLGLGKFEDADKCADEGLQMVKEGRLHAQLQLLQGDIAYTHGNAYAAAGDKVNAQVEWKKAAGSFVVVSQIFVDPEITPEAADKAANALEKIGEKAKAESLRKQLATKYPNYKAK